MGVDHFFHFTGVHVLAAGENHVLHPINDVEETLFIPLGQVARVEPSVGECGL